MPIFNVPFACPHSTWGSLFKDPQTEFLKPVLGIGEFVCADLLFNNKLKRLGK